MSEENKNEEEGKVVEMEAPQSPGPEEEGKEASEAETHVTPLEKMMQKQAEAQKAMMEFAETLREEGFEGHTYGEGSVVQLPGGEFAKYSNFLATLQKNLGTIQYSINQTFQLAEALITAATEYQLEFMEMHLANCRAGITITNEEMNREDALKEIVKTEEDGVKIEVEE